MAKTPSSNPDATVTAAAAETVDCQGCNAQCCRYIATQIDTPTDKTDYDHIRWYLFHRDVSVFIDHEDDWYLEFKTDCEALDAQGRCEAYDIRPRICQRHGDVGPDCEFHGAESPYQLRFETPALFEAWLDEQGRKWRPKKPR